MHHECTCVGVISFKYISIWEVDDFDLRRLQNRGLVLNPHAMKEAFCNKNHTVHTAVGVGFNHLFGLNSTT